MELVLQVAKAMQSSQRRLRGGGGRGRGKLSRSRLSFSVCHARGTSENIIIGHETDTERRNTRKTEKAFIHVKMVIFIKVCLMFNIC